MSGWDFLRELRQVVETSGVRRALGKARYRLRLAAALRTGDIETRFSNIYARGLWFGNGESRSGSGSTARATEPLRAELPRLLAEIGAERLLDLGCGDFHWMRTVALPCRYLGADIVGPVIDENRSRYGTDRIEFVHLDGTREPLPPADVVLCREVLFHLSFRDAAQLLENVRRSSATYFLATTNPTVAENRDIETGNFRELDLGALPFALPAPARVLRDDVQIPGRVLGVWRVADIR